MKKTLSLILCLCMLLSVSCIGAFATDRITTCGGECEYYPTIIIPGLGQSSVCVADEEGNFVLDEDGNKISAFPAYIQTDELLKTALVPALLSVLTQQDFGLSDAVGEAIGLCFSINGTGLDAQPSGNTITEKFPYPLSECNDYERAVINSHIPFNMYHTDLPEDHTYYFCYNSFANHIDATEELYEYIEMVKEQTGHDKVNLVPLSQGATLASALLEYHPEIVDSLHKVLFVVPALDGSTIIGDVFNGRVNFLNKDYLYNGFLGELGLLDNQTARLIEILLRILPDDVLMEALNSAVDVLVGDVMSKCTSMWALCPSGDYPTAAEKYLSSPEMAEIKAQTDKYYNAQLNSRKNIQNLLDNGVQVFCIAEYDINVINVGESWNAQNGDYIIQLDSTSMGAYSAKVGETLPEDYVQQNTYCSDPTHNHISPDRVVDASTGLLPDTTFYFDNQRHDLTQHNDVILRIAMELIAHDNITDVYSDPNFPQFNDGRDVRNLLSLIETAEGVEQTADITAAIAKGESVLGNNLSTAEDYADAEKALTDLLVACGAMEAEKENTFLANLFEKISLWLYDNFGTKGFSQMPTVIFEKLNSLLSNIGA